MILIVEDSETQRYALSNLLEQKGYHVRQAATATEGLRQILELRPQVLITDLVMEGMDGLQLIRALEEKGIRVPTVIVMTALPEPLPQFPRGDVVTIYKPFKVDELVELICKVAPLEQGAKK